MTARPHRVARPTRIAQRHGMIRLDRPHVRAHRSYLEEHDEFGAAQRDGDGDWVEAPDDGGYAGVAWTRDELAVRHGLTPFLLEVGGHIGYSVRPSARRR